MTDAESVDRGPIRSHILSKIGGDESLLPGDSESLVDAGILDSFGLAELLLLIENEYGVKVPTATSIELLESIDKIVDYISSHR